MIVGASNKALVGTFSVIVKSLRFVYSSSKERFSVTCEGSEDEELA